MRVARRVTRREYDKWRGRMRLMAAEPYALPYVVVGYKCGDYYCVKTRLLDDDNTITMLAMSKPHHAVFKDHRYYVDVEKLEKNWNLYKEVERIITELSKAGEL